MPNMAPETRHITPRNVRTLRLLPPAASLGANALAKVSTPITATIAIDARPTSWVPKTSRPAVSSPCAGSGTPGGSCKEGGTSKPALVVPDRPPDASISFELKLATIPKTNTRINVIVACMGTVRKEKVDAVELTLGS